MKVRFSENEQHPLPLAILAKQKQTKDYLQTGRVVQSLDGEPLDFSNMELKAIEGRIKSNHQRNSEIRQTQTD